MVALAPPPPPACVMCEGFACLFFKSSSPKHWKKAANQMRQVTFAPGTLQPSVDRFLRKVGRPRTHWTTEVGQLASKVAGGLKHLQDAVFDESAAVSRYDLCSTCSSVHLATSTQYSAEAGKVRNNCFLFINSVFWQSFKLLEASNTSRELGTMFQNHMTIGKHC